MKSRSRTSLFLMELILSILLFSLCSTVCVRLFTQSWQMQKKAEALNQASLICDSTAALIQANKRLPDNTEQYFDDSFASCSFQNAVWILKIEEPDDVSIRQVRIRMLGAASNALYPDETLFEFFAGY